MSKIQNEIQPMLKTYQIFILSFLLTSLIILNSSHFNQNIYEIKLDQEKKILFKNIISKRFLEGDDTPVTPSGRKTNPDTEKVCDLGSEELKKYYETGDLEKIQLKEEGIECREKDEEYMKALISIVKSYTGYKKKEGEEEGEINDKLTKNITTYAKHILPVLVFAVVAILCIPGWIICCFCCCCNCCCCCCCKKTKCKIPCFIISYAMYALVDAVCVYGLAQTNHIFIGVADTECSILKFIDEVLGGESKKTTPKWGGINGIKGILENIQSNLNTMEENTMDSLQEKLDLIDNKAGEGKKYDFFEGFLTFTNDYSSSGSKQDNYLIDLPTDSNDYATGKYLLDVVSEFGTFDINLIKGNPFNSPAYWWVEEY